MDAAQMAQMDMSNIDPSIGLQPMSNMGPMGNMNNMSPPRCGGDCNPTERMDFREHDVRALRNSRVQAKTSPLLPSGLLVSRRPSLDTSTKLREEPGVDGDRTACAWGGPPIVQPTTPMKAWTHSLATSPPALPTVTPLPSPHPPTRTRFHRKPLNFAAT